jgi:hypothetical protein
MKKSGWGFNISLGTAKEVIKSIYTGITINIAAIIAIGI